jgi:GntR family transcriptional regulator
MWTEKIVDRESQQKLYVQIYSILKEKIEKHDWQNNNQIPTEDDLCKIYQVSKATVRMAISELVRTGYLKKQQGKGTFVTSALPDLGIAMKTRLTENVLGEGVKVKKELIERGLRELSGDIRTILRFAEKDDKNDDLFYILCRRLVDGEPAYLEESFVPLAMFPGIPNEDVCAKPLYDLIQEKGLLKIFKVVQTIELSELKAEAASLLRVSESTPALLLHRLLIGSDAQPIAYTRLLGIGKKYKIQTEFERIK